MTDANRGRGQATTPITKSRDGSIDSVVVDAIPSHQENQAKNDGGTQTVPEEPRSKEATRPDTQNVAVAVKKFVRPSIPATNLIAMKRENADITGTWLLNPTLHIPQSLLPPLDSTKFPGPRPTLLLETKAGVVADIWLTGQPSADQPVTIRVLAGIGEYTPPSRHSKERGGHTAAVMIHALGGHTVKLEVDTSQITTFESYWPDVDLLLPADFVGNMTISAKNILISKALSHLITQFSDMKNASTWFVGDWVESNFAGGEQWSGSSVKIQGYTVRLGVTEVDDWINSSTAGFFHATLDPQLRSTLLDL